MNPVAKQLLELGPILAFVVVNFKYSIKAGIITFLILAPIGMLITWIYERKISPIQWLGLIMILGFGGMALLFDDPRIFKIKPTVASGLFAAILLGGYALKKPLIKSLFGSAFEMPDQVWLKLTLRWGLFFVAMAVANEIAWRNLSDGNWGLFKLALFPVSLIFGAFQAPLLMKYMKQDDE